VGPSTSWGADSPQPRYYTDSQCDGIVTKQDKLMRHAVGWDDKSLEIPKQQKKNRGF